MNSNQELMRTALAMENHSSAAQPTVPAPEKGGGGKFEEAVKAMREVAKEGISPQANGQDPAKPGTPEKPQEQKGPAEPEKGKDGTPDNSNWEKRYNDLRSKADKDTSKVEKFARRALLSDANYIHDLYREDPELANRIIATDLKEKGIKNYEEMIEALEQEKLPKDQVEINKRIKELELKLEEKEERELEMQVESFINSHDDIDEAMVETMTAYLEKGDFTLEEVYELAQLKLGKVKSIDVEVLNKYNTQEAASKISTTGGSSSGVEQKQLTDQEIRVLQGLGATQTLKKHGITT